MGSESRLIEGTVVFCGGACGLNCSLCPLVGKKAALPAPQVKKAIAEAARLGAKRVVLAGGDPLLRKDIVELVRFARSRRMSVGLATNARMLLYPDLRRALLAGGVDAVIVAPVGVGAGVHDDMTRTKGSFLQSLAAAREVLQHESVTLELRLPVIAGFGPAAARLLPSLGSRRPGRAYLTFYYPVPCGCARPRKDFLSPDAAAGLVSPALAACAATGLRAFYEGLPPCLMGRDAASESVAERLIPLDRKAATCLGLPAAEDFAQALLCSECALEQTCRGLHKKAVETFAFDAVKPLKEVRSNSFEYIFDRELEGFQPSRAGCRGDALLKGGSPLRSVYFEKDGRVSLYRTDTMSFGEAELGAAKLSREQLYLDISDKPMHDDFQNQVRQLAMKEACRLCSRKERCAVCYAALDEVPFEREERWLRQEIRRLNGRVLDVGCGDLRFYGETVAGLLAQGRAEYHGLDVDARALAQLKKRLPRAHVHRGPIEDFAFQEGYFDYIFALRSLNHFYDLEKAFAAMTALLRDYGVVVIAECVPFGLLRSRRQARRARSAAGPGFEHYRNWSSEQVLEFVRKKGFPLKLNTHRPVRPGTSNQWLLKLIKIPEA